MDRFYFNVSRMDHLILFIPKLTFGLYRTSHDSGLNLVLDISFLNLSVSITVDVR